MNFADSLAKAKEEFRNSPIKFLKQPRFWLFIPIITFRALWIRIRYNYQIVYCTETDFDSLFITLEMQSNPSAEILVLTDLASTSILAKFHEVENQSKTDTMSKAYAKRINRGDRCFLLLINNEPVSYHWVASENVYIETTDSLYDLPTNCCVIYDGFTSSLYRGKGYYRLLYSLSTRQLFEEGFRKVWIWVMRHNIVTIKAHDQLGFKQIKYEISLCTFLGFTKRRIRRVDYPILDLLK